MGPNSDFNDLKHYISLPILCIFTALLSYLSGTVGVRLFNLPRWIVPANIFNNAVSLPLLLSSSLASTGALDTLVALTVDDTRVQALSRAKTYILSKRSTALYHLNN